MNEYGTANVGKTFYDLEDLSKIFSKSFYSHGDEMLCMIYWYLFRILIKIQSGMMCYEQKVFCHHVKLLRFQKKMLLTSSRILLQKSQGVSLVQKDKSPSHWTQ